MKNSPTSVTHMWDTIDEDDLSQKLSTEAKISLHALQQYDWDRSSISQIITYLESGVLPERLDNRQKARFREKFQTNFTTDGKVLVYTPLNLKVISSDEDKEAIEKRLACLEELFGTDEAIGKGQNNFHQLVLRHYLGIKREHVIEFLRGKPEYQLFQRRPRIVSRSAHPKYPLHYIAIDLLHVSKKGYNLRNRLNNDVKEGKDYVFVAVDLFTNYSWFYLLKKADTDATKQAFRKILKHNLRLRFPDDERVQREMEERDQLEYPTYVLSDGGPEFEGDFKTYLREKGVKQIFRESHSPQPHVEAVNNVLRSLMRAQFIRNRDKEWKKYINDGTFMRAKNSNRDNNTGQYSDLLFENYMKAQGESVNTTKEKKKLLLEDVIDVAKDKTKEREAKLREKRNRSKRQRFKVGETVRIKLSSQQKSVRKKIKAHEGKSLVVRFSADVYTVDKVKGSDPNGLSVYFLKDKDKEDVKKLNDKRRPFKGSELLRVSPNKYGVFEEYMTQRKVNELNGVQEDDLMNDKEKKEALERSILKEKEDKAVKKRKQAEKDEKRRNMLQEPINQWGIKHWEKALINNEFDDEGTRWRITDVSFQEKVDGYNSTYNIYFESNSGEEKFTYLPWLFSEIYPGVRKEKWFQERRKAYESLADNNYRKNAPVETFQMGDAVYAWWWNKKKHTSKYKATVEKVNENGTYDIVYNDDGKKEKEVKSIYMTSLQEKHRSNVKRSRKKVITKPLKMTLRNKRK